VWVVVVAMGKGTRATPRISLNNKLNHQNENINLLQKQNKENMKRILLFFDRLTNLNKLPYEQSTWILDLKEKAQLGDYFHEDKTKDEEIVNWKQLLEDIQLYLDLLTSEVNEIFESLSFSQTIRALIF
jgi:Mg2+ and Co2+ transporter CorA